MVRRGVGRREAVAVLLPFVVEEIARGTATVRFILPFAAVADGAASKRGANDWVEPFAHQLCVRIRRRRGVTRGRSIRAPSSTKMAPQAFVVQHSRIDIGAANLIPLEKVRPQPVEGEAGGRREDGGVAHGASRVRERRVVPQPEGLAELREPTERYEQVVVTVRHRLQLLLLGRRPRR